MRRPAGPHLEPVKGRPEKSDKTIMQAARRKSVSSRKAMALVNRLVTLGIR